MKNARTWSHLTFIHNDVSVWLFSMNANTANEADNITPLARNFQIILSVQTYKVKTINHNSQYFITHTHTHLFIHDHTSALVLRHFPCLSSGYGCYQFPRLQDSSSGCRHTPPQNHCKVKSAKEGRDWLSKWQLEFSPNSAHHCGATSAGIHTLITACHCTTSSLLWLPDSSKLEHIAVK